MLSTAENIDKLQRCYQNSKISILITGKTGTGKSRLARRIHNKAKGKHSPFIHLNAASLPCDLMESEIFGHTRGAFTGAQKDQPGKLELAAAGTLFIDEVGELNHSLQAKLLTFLDTKRYYPLGARSEKKFLGSLIFATNVDLEQAVLEGRFRADLLFRLKTFCIKLPELHNSPALLKRVAVKYLIEFNREYGHKNVQLTDALWSWMEQYSWPGNMRELRNLMEYLVAMSDGGYVSLADLPEWIGSRQIEKISWPVEETVNLTYHEALRLFEKKFLQNELKRRSGRVNRTAKELCMSKTTLIAKTRKYGIKSAAS